MFGFEGGGDIIHTYIHIIHTPYIPMYLKKKVKVCEKKRNIIIIKCSYI